MPVFHESPWTAWKFISAPCKITLFVPTDQRECSGPTIFGNRHTNEPFCSAVGLGFLDALNRVCGARTVPRVVVVVGGTVVVVVGTVVVVVVVVVVVDAGTNF